MILLRALSVDERATYLESEQAHYVEDLVANHRLTKERAEAEAVHGAADLGLGDDQASGMTVLGIATSDGLLLGRIAFTEAPATASAYVLDFGIFPEWQGKGYGSAAMTAIEAYFRARGITQLRLRVAANNPRARALYDRIGFFAPGTNMAKDL